MSAGQEALGEAYTERHGTRGEIVLNRPQRRNALSRALVEGARAGLAEFIADDGIEVILIRGADDTFCAGMDMKAQREQPRPAWLDGFDEVWAALHGDIYHCPKPIVGALQGFAVGGGAALAFACDVLIAGESAQLQLIEVSIGMPAPVTLAWLDLKFGRAITLELALSSDRDGARELLERGLVARVEPDDRLLEEARAYADHLAVHPQAGLRAVKTTLWQLDAIEDFGERVRSAQAAWREGEGRTPSDQGPAS